jgi:hypothetical protein
MARPDWLPSFVLVGLVLGASAGCTQRDRAATADAGAAPLASASTLASASASASAAPAPELGFIDPPARVPVAVPVVPSTEWVWKTYRGDHFSVLFPGEPKVTVLPAEDDKIGYTEARIEVPGGQVSFAAGFSEHSKEQVAKPEAFLDEHVQTPRRGFTDVLTKRSITLPTGQPGRVVILRRNISGTPLRVYSRLYLVGLRLYSLIVSTLDEGGVSEDVVKKFMDSFRPL